MKHGSLAKRLCHAIYQFVILRSEPAFFVPIRTSLINVMLGRQHVNLKIWPDVYIGYYPNLKIGDHVTINRGTHLSCNGGLTIGSYVGIGHSVTILTTEHSYSDKDVPIRSQPLTMAPTVIGSDVWIGAKACILAGVTIADGTIVAAGAIVTKSVEKPNTIIGGVPARHLKNRFGERQG